MKYLICYDIPDNKCRRRVAKYLESLGRRLQYSVFVADCSHEKLAAIKNKLLCIIAEQEDLVLTIVPLCQSCEAKLWQKGKPMEEAELCIIA